jgi:hypothetical protein
VVGQRLLAERRQRQRPLDQDQRHRHDDGERPRVQEHEADADADRGDDAVLDQEVGGEEPARREVVLGRQPDNTGEQRVVDEHEGEGRDGRGEHGALRLAVLGDACGEEVPMTDAARAAARAVPISTTGSRRLVGEGEAAAPHGEAAR